MQRELEHYNLDMIISVGYRVKSQVATRFRIWATQRLKEYIVKGFALNDERFKSGNSMNYFTELQERIREIRLSERFFYQKIKDIYATSIDKDWIERLDAIIQLNGRELLDHAGKISHQKALEKSAMEFNKYLETQKQIEHEESLKELEQDIKRLTP